MTTGPSRNPADTTEAGITAASGLTAAHVEVLGWRIMHGEATSYEREIAAKIILERAEAMRSLTPSETAKPDFPYAIPSIEEVERTMKDAARYRWLRSEEAATNPLFYSFWNEFNAKLCREGKMDHLIDEAMERAVPASRERGPV